MYFVSATRDLSDIVWSRNRLDAHRWNTGVYLHSPAKSKSSRTLRVQYAGDVRCLSYFTNMPWGWLI